MTRRSSEPPHASSPTLSAPASHASSAHELDALVAIAQQSEAPPLDALRARRMVKHALATTSHQTLSMRRRVRAALLCAAAALFVFLGGYAHSRLRPDNEIAVAARGLPSRLSLKTGDVLVLAPKAMLQVLSEKPALRRVRLAQGSALFDVTRKKETQRFEVETPHAKVRVRGTVFTVQVSAKRSVVRVHEGSVWVGERVVTAGEVFSSDGQVDKPAGGTEDVLAADLRATLAARAGAREATSVPEAPSLGSDAEPRTLTPSTSDIRVEASTATASAPAAQVDEAPPAPQAHATAPVPRAREATPAPAAQAQRAPPPSPAVNDATVLDYLRSLLRVGRADEAISFARARATSSEAFHLLLADALRSEGRFVEAHVEYRTLAERTRGPLRAHSAFAAAEIALVALHDPARALACIEHFAIAREEAALRERASVLEVDALLQLGRSAEARDVAARYLAREPETESSTRMRRVLGEAREPN